MVEAFLRRAEAHRQPRGTRERIRSDPSAITAETWGFFEHWGYHASLQLLSEVL